MVVFTALSTISTLPHISDITYFAIKKQNSLDSYGGFDFVSRDCQGT